LVECVEAGDLVAVGGEGFAVSGRQPGSQDSRRGCIGATAGAIEQFDRVAGLPDVD
jgi:hypothetical protein